MHVLVIPSNFPTPGNPLGGVFFKHQALALAERGAEVGVVFPDPRSLAGASRRDLLKRPFRTEVGEVDGITTYVSPYPSLPKAHRFRAWLWLRRLEHLVERYVADRGVPDIVHAHGLLWAGVGATRSELARRAPVVVTAHYSNYAEGLLSRRQLATVTGALQRADLVLAVSESLRKELVALAPGLVVRIMPNMVDLNLFTLAEREPRREFRWLTTAVSMTPNKALDVLIEGFHRAFVGDPDVSLTLIGSGQEERRLKALVDRLGITARVRFAGRLSREDVARAMSETDAFVLSSQVETFGVVLIEAMATGLPVVSTASGGPDEIVTDETGLLVPVGDAAAMAQSMRSVYDRRDHWREAAPGIRAHVEERYSEDVVVDATIETYERVITAESRSTG